MRRTKEEIIEDYRFHAERLIALTEVQMILLPSPLDDLRRKMIADVRSAAPTARGTAGIKMAINDFFEVISDIASAMPGLLAKADKLLTERGQPTLTDLLNRHSSQIQSVLASGKIKSETEYYLVQDHLSDSFDRMADADRKRASGMLAVYEKNFEGRKK